MNTDPAFNAAIEATVARLATLGRIPQRRDVIEAAVLCCGEFDPANVARYTECRVVVWIPAGE